ncbi:fasciclin domain-containing protein [Haloflavibacter putidus]|uniref:Fasciclin domain-containing protein n=1 Tax=Haloflavibacter putidus TaxID=2576776 RepID=A0A507ZFF5_9FLAO|nr:fasciclin domain-containing protein [Haloflavibacter putidus]TQD33625.1 fasciclin domain-containing protein [Haloflavibacter putidus]
MKIKNVLMLIAVASLSFFSCKNENKDKDAMQKDTETTMDKANNKENADKVMDSDNMNDKSTESSEEMNLADITKGEASLSTLNDAVKSAGMVAKLKSEGPFTILAPNNEAFKQLPDETLDNLMQPDNKEQLEGVLSYHIVPGNVDSNKLKKLIENNDGTYELVTANDGKLEASMNDAGEIILTDGRGKKAKVVEADKKGQNGVIHSIDTVLMRS